HDWVLDIAVTPNRPDALGHVGLAREAAALCELPFSFPDPAAPKRIAQGKGIDAFARVEIADTERCPIYAAAMVTQVKIGPSPDWLRYRLESLGVRAISNVVDVTNLVLLEFGQPMHAFDLERVRGARIEVRRAREGEELVTLDGTARKLDPDDLVIADGEGAVGLAGVMGGANSEIGAGTSRVLLECAHFTPRGIRRTARRHAMHTEASHRFERGVDPGAIPDVLAHAASLLTELAGGAAVPGSILAGPGVPPRGPSASAPRA
ncbi:MAG: phenylalanine--tRNA ligase beta subunit-related protein, partial [Polyangiaceae bacterium]